MEVQRSVLQCVGINDVETRLFPGLLLLIFFVLFILSFATPFIPSLLFAVWLLTILNQLVAMVNIVNLHVFKDLGETVACHVGVETSLMIVRADVCRLVVRESRVKSKLEYISEAFVILTLFINFSQIRFSEVVGFVRKYF